MNPGNAKLVKLKDPPPMAQADLKLPTLPNFKKTPPAKNLDSKLPALALLKVATKKTDARYERTRAEPTNDLALEDLTQLEAHNDLSDFVGRANLKVGPYFAAMEANAQLNKEFTEASRRNRSKQRKKLTMNEIQEIRNKNMADKKEGRRVRQIAYQAAKKEKELESLRLQAIKKFGKD